MTIPENYDIETVFYANYITLVVKVSMAYPKS